MISKPIEKLWVLPTKYWTATSNMTPEQIDRMVEEILEFADHGNIEALRKYEFLSLEDPYLQQKRAA
jgi:hypothetical protein